MNISTLRSGGLRLAATCLSLILGLHASSAVAAPIWTIAAPEISLRSNEPVVLDVFRPTPQDAWPEVLKFRLEQEGKVWEVELSADKPVSPDDTRRTYRGVLPDRSSGLLRGTLVGVESNRLAFEVRVQDAIERMMSPADGKGVGKQPRHALSVLMQEDEPTVSAHDPMYFVVGNGGVARFQLSFKYRVFDSDSLAVARFSPLANFYFGYTQTSKWDLSADSKPFRDTSYRPSFFWQGVMSGDGIRPDGVRAGFEHESNGKDGINSRSINMFFVQPAWITNYSDGHILYFAPKIYDYQDKTDNPNIQRYRGYADWIVGFGRPNSTIVTMQLREGTGGYGSAEINVSYPLRNQLFARAGGFMYLQLFKGYGDTLLDYNRNSSTQVRLGFAIVR